jgi:hypothetical protein
MEQSTTSRRTECLCSCLVGLTSLSFSLISNHSTALILKPAIIAAMIGRVEERIPAAQAARLIGVKTQTLAKWRCSGKGPGGWIRVSATLVTYPRREVEQFLSARPCDRRG